MKIVFNLISVPRKDYNQNVYNSRKYYLDNNPSSFKYSKFNDEEKKRYILSTHWALSKVVCISGKILVNKQVQDFKMYSENESKLLSAFISEIINKNLNALWIHFNGLNNDVPLILRRAIKYNIDIKNDDFKNLIKFRKFPHYDCASILSNWSPDSYLELPDVCGEFNIECGSDYPGGYFSDVESEITKSSINRTNAICSLYNKMQQIF